mmetsp:Transcript_7208/g.14037  ORF Transcript_7208/g.14037 Transcript_7208/m.14037 type:complete len:147 (+) Transcript_7208:918-1358(+)
MQHSSLNFMHSPLRHSLIARTVNSFQATAAVISDIHIADSELAMLDSIVMAISMRNIRVPLRQMIKSMVILMAVRQDNPRGHDVQKRTVHFLQSHFNRTPLFTVYSSRHTSHMEGSGFASIHLIRHASWTGALHLQTRYNGPSSPP